MIAVFKVVILKGVSNASADCRWEAAALPLIIYRYGNAACYFD